MKTQYIQLSDRIAWNSKSLVEDILSKNKDLDLLYRKGMFFRMAIESNQTDITEMLLEYFKDNQLSRYNNNSEEYNNLESQLIEVIEVAIDEVELLPEMKKILSPYIEFENSVDSREHDFDEFDFPDEFDLDNEQNLEITASGQITEYNHNAATVLK
jgi:hypothetical protein